MKKRKKQKLIHTVHFFNKIGLINKDQKEAFLESMKKKPQ